MRNVRYSSASCDWNSFFGTSYSEAIAASVSCDTLGRPSESSAATAGMAAFCLSADTRLRATLPTAPVSAPPMRLTGILLDGVSTKPAAPVTATRPAIAPFARGGGIIFIVFVAGGEAS